MLKPDTHLCAPIVFVVSDQDALEMKSNKKDIPLGFTLQQVNNLNAESFVWLLVPKGFEAEICRIDGNDNEWICCIPTRIALVGKGAHLRARNTAAVSRQALASVQTQLECKCFYSKDLHVRRLLGGMVASHPNVSSLIWEHTLPIAGKVMLRQMGFDNGDPKEVKTFHGMWPART
jgi:hypothetical protein